MRVRFLWRNFFRKRSVEHELNEELQSSLELLIEAKIRKGLSWSEARTQALIELGGMEQVKEEVRSSRIGHWIEDIVRDLRYGTWVLTKKPGFTLVALIVLGLGIGANTAIFSIINAFMFRPLPVRAPEELVSIYGYANNAAYPIVYPDYMAFREQTQVFAGLAAFDLINVPLSRDGSMRRLYMEVSRWMNWREIIGRTAWNTVNSPIWKRMTSGEISCPRKK
jgi:hypothetical protein